MQNNMLYIHHVYVYVQAQQAVILVYKTMSKCIITVLHKQ